MCSKVLGGSEEELLAKPGCTLRYCTRLLCVGGNSVCVCVCVDELLEPNNSSSDLADVMEQINNSFPACSRKFPSSLPPPSSLSSSSSSVRPPECRSAEKLLPWRPKRVCFAGVQLNHVRSSVNRLIWCDTVKERLHFNRKHYFTSVFVSKE